VKDSVLYQGRKKCCRKTSDIFVIAYSNGISLNTYDFDSL